MHSSLLMKTSKSCLSVSTSLEYLELITTLIIYFKCDIVILSLKDNLDKLNWGIRTTSSTSTTTSRWSIHKATSHYVPLPHGEVPSPHGEVHTSPPHIKLSLLHGEIPPPRDVCIPPPYIKAPLPHCVVPTPHNGMCIAPNAGNLTLLPPPYKSETSSSGLYP